MGYTLIAPIGGDTKTIFVGMKEFPTSTAILLSLKEHQKDALNLAKKLEDFTIKTKIVLLEDNVLESMFKEFANICSTYNNDDLIVNVGAGTHGLTCAALSASYANGLKAFDVMGDAITLLPILKLSYYHELSDNKMNLLDDKLIMASMLGNTHQASSYLKEGADVNAKNEFGRRPIHFCSMYQNITLLKILLDNGARVNVKDREGNTPLKLARQRRLHDTCELLIKAGAKENPWCTCL